MYYNPIRVRTQSLFIRGVRVSKVMTGLVSFFVACVRAYVLR